MSKQRKNYPLRMPEDLFNEIKRWAEAEMRSVNGQIEFILRQAVRKKKSRSDGSDDSEETDRKSN